MAFTEAPMRRLVFHGPMKSRFGSEYFFKAHNAKKLISAAVRLLPGFEKYLNDSRARGLTFAVFIGRENKRNVTKEELEINTGCGEIHLLPVIIGSKTAGLFQTILGAAILALSLWNPMVGSATLFTAKTATTLSYFGASLALGGITQMLSPQLTGLRMRQDPNNKPSYAFGGPVNTTTQGNPVGILYGSREIGGAIVSAGIYAEDQQ